MQKHLRIVTPEQVVIEYPIAGLGSRAIAALIDGLIIGIVDIGLTIGLVAGIFRLAGNQTTATLPEGAGAHAAAWVIGGYLLLLFLFTVGYYVACEGFWAGKSPGKWLLRLRVISVEGRPITFSSSLIRNVVRILDFLPSGYLVGMIAVFVSPREQRIGDLAAGTVVVMDRLYAGFGGVGRPRRRKRGKLAASDSIRLRAVDDGTPIPDQAIAIARHVDEPTRDLVTNLLLRVDALQTQKADVIAQRIVARIKATLPAGRDDLQAWLYTGTALEQLMTLQRAWEEPQS